MSKREPSELEEKAIRSAELCWKFLGPMMPDVPDDNPVMHPKYMIAMVIGREFQDWEEELGLNAKP